MIITISNQYLKATISAKGAELQSLYGLETGIEYMWSGNAAFWGKHSPVLFPIVGSLKEDTYYYDEKKYQLPRHGFARDKDFLAEQLSDTEAVFTLTATEDTLDVYPFDFILKLRYRLEGNLISCTYEVENPGTGELYFSIGGHPAFAVPFAKDTVYEDYYLEWNKPETLLRWKLEEGLIAGGAGNLLLKNNSLPLTYSLFYEDAIVVKQMQSDCISLKNTTNEHSLHFHFNDFPFFGIWAARDAPFVCLEPWCGIADSINHDQQLISKEGIQKLASKADWQRTWKVECF